MTDQVDAVRLPPSVTDSSPVILRVGKQRRRLLLDRLASRLVTLGGISIIASILAILLVIVAEVYPLFKKPTVTAGRTMTAALDSAPMGLGVDEYLEVVYLISASGLQFVSAINGRPFMTVQLPDLHDAYVVSSSP